MQGPPYPPFPQTDPERAQALSSRVSHGVGCPGQVGRCTQHCQLARFTEWEQYHPI